TRPAPRVEDALSLHDALPISAAIKAVETMLGELEGPIAVVGSIKAARKLAEHRPVIAVGVPEREQRKLPATIQLAEKVSDRLRRSEEHTSELQSREKLVCRLQ